MGDVIQDSICESNITTYAFNSCIKNNGFRLSPASIAYGVISHLKVDENTLEDMVLFESVDKLDGATIWDVVFTFKPNVQYNHDLAEKIGTLIGIKMFKIKNQATPIKKLVASSIGIWNCPLTGRLIESIQNTMKDTAFKFDNLSVDFFKGAIGKRSLVYLNRDTEKKINAWQSALDHAYVAHMQFPRMTKHSNLVIYGNGKNKLWAIDDLITNEVPKHLRRRVFFRDQGLDPGSAPYVFAMPSLAGYGFYMVSNINNWLFSGRPSDDWIITELTTMLNFNVVKDGFGYVPWTGMVIILDERTNVIEIAQSMGKFADFFSFINGEEDAINHKEILAQKYCFQTQGTHSGIQTVSMIRQL